MQILKQDVVDLVDELPEKFDMEEFMYKLHLLDKVTKGQNDMQKGDFISADALRREIRKW